MQKQLNVVRRIAAEDEDSYVVRSGRADAGLIVLCDHAGNAFPPGYGTLGLPAAELERHIAYDPGAAGIARRIAAAFDAPAVLTRYSRLLIDPNRGADDPTLIMRLADGTVIPGNRHLDEVERARRERLYYAPYHTAIERVLAACLAAGRPPLVFSVHSFTEAWKGKPRPWHVGILWDTDATSARAMIDGFAADPDLIVGDNQPYKGSLEGDCLWQHATRRGLANVLIEYRQDLIRDEASQSQWAERTIAILADMLAPELHSTGTAAATAG